MSPSLMNFLNDTARRSVMNGWNYNDFLDDQALTADATLGIENCGQKGQDGRKADDSKRDQSLFVDFQSFLLNWFIWNCIRFFSKLNSRGLSHNWNDGSRGENPEFEIKFWIGEKWRVKGMGTGNKKYGLPRCRSIPIILFISFIPVYPVFIPCIPFIPVKSSPCRF